MTVLRTSVIFEKKWLATQIDAAIACPTLEGNIFGEIVSRVVATSEVMSFTLGILGFIEQLILHLVGFLLANGT